MSSKHSMWAWGQIGDGRGISRNSIARKRLGASSVPIPHANARTINSTPALCERPNRRSAFRPIGRD